MTFGMSAGFGGLFIPLPCISWYAPQVRAGNAWPLGFNQSPGAHKCMFPFLYFYAAGEYLRLL